jgi:hypothetical protein
MQRALQHYINELKSDIHASVYAEGKGVSFEDKFTEYCIKVFEGIGKTEAATALSYIHPNSQGGINWKINGYGLKDYCEPENETPYFETLDLFITYYKNENYQYNITKEEYTKSLNQVKRFINASLKGSINYIDKSHTELNKLIKIIGKQGNDFDRINVYFLINGFTNHEKEKMSINDIAVFIHTWDISRLFKTNQTTSVQEPITINFNDFSKEGKGIQCLQVPAIDPLYDCYLAIVPGKILAKLYKEYGNELLENNVRAFLGQTRKFNKGIRDTIRKKPHMFLPYNNGITATAESLETSLRDNQLFITKLNDFQIVNGGQTTASLYHTHKKFKEVDLGKIFVQMKLTIIKDQAQKNIEVPNISRFANSQNKVSELDLSSNNPYLVQIETLSRKKYVVDPENKPQLVLWFFERASGQYREMLSRCTPSQKKKFKSQYPKSLKFVKSDIAKFINLCELEPHFVAQGSQKNFIHFTKKINALVNENKLPGDNFYKKLIANAILYQHLAKLFGRKNINAIGDTNLRAFTVSYTVAYFHYLTKNRLDLWKIYEEQTIDNLLSDHLENLLIFVYKHLTEEGKGGLISEYAKKETSWSKLKAIPYDKNLELILAAYLIGVEAVALRENEK